MLALPPAEAASPGVSRLSNPAQLALTQSKQSGQLSASRQEDAMAATGSGAPGTRDYNELMDVYSQHQIMYRKGQLLDTTPEFISFKRTYLNRWGSISFILHLL
jgi:hypothetical protein